MTCTHDFVIDLARAGQRASKILELSRAAHGDQALSLNQIYWIIADVKSGKDATDKRHQNPKRTKRTNKVVEDVRTFVEEDQRVSLEDICSRFELSNGTVQNILHQDLGLVKRSARWVPKQLTDDHKLERLHCT